MEVYTMVRKRGLGVVEGCGPNRNVTLVEVKLPRCQALDVQQKSQLLIRQREPYEQTVNGFCEPSVRRDCYRANLANTENNHRIPRV